MHFSTLIRILLALLLLLTPATAATVTLEGTVSYRERIALPEGATLRVSLVRLESVAPIIGANATLPVNGQVPIGFVLNVHTGIDMFDGSYGVIAEISAGGRVLFVTPVPSPVPDTPGSRVAVRLNYAPQPIVETPVALSDPGFLDVEWKVTSIGGRPVSGNRPPTLTIAADHRATGSGGCNNFFAEASLTDDGISFGPAAATRMMCDKPAMEQEADFFAALAAVTAYEHDTKGLRLLDVSGIPLIGLVRTTE